MVPHIFQKCNVHLRILGIERVTRNEHTEYLSNVRSVHCDLQVLTVPTNAELYNYVFNS